MSLDNELYSLPPKQENEEDSVPCSQSDVGFGEGVRVVQSEDLFGPNCMVIIKHCDVCYRLTVTRNNKLILQK